MPRRASRATSARADVKHRLVGHWGTTPGINFLFAHVNRLIADHGQNTIFLMGPGHGGPAGTAQSLLDGTYREIRPDITDDEAGLEKFFRQFSYPGGIPSHFAPETPGSIHEGGELGYTLSHAYGAVLDNPSCSPLPWWETARPRPARSPRAGSPTSS